MSIHTWLFVLAVFSQRVYVQKKLFQEEIPYSCEVISGACNGEMSRYSRQTQNPILLETTHSAIISIKNTSPPAPLKSHTTSQCFHFSFTSS